MFPGLVESFSFVPGDCFLQMCLASSPLPGCSGPLFILSNGTLVSFSFFIASYHWLQVKKCYLCSVNWTSVKKLSPLLSGWDTEVYILYGLESWEAQKPFANNGLWATGDHAKAILAGLTCPMQCYLTSLLCGLPCWVMYFVVLRNTFLNIVILLKILE